MCVKTHQCTVVEPPDIIDFELSLSVPDSIGQLEFQSTNISDDCDTATCNQNSTVFFSKCAKEN